MVRFKQVIMKDLTILMSWHYDSHPESIKVYSENRNSFLINNNDLEIYSVPNRYMDKNKAWISTDLNIFHWFIEQENRIKSERFLIVEWDCRCNCNLRQYYGKVWDYDVVGPCVYYPERDHWNWFNTIQRLPYRARRFATGIVPFNAILLSKRAMSLISKEILKPEFYDFNSELRLATIASMLSMDPVVNPVCNRTNTWRNNIRWDMQNGGLFHPVKAI